MVDELDMRDEQTPRARKLRETIQTLILRTSTIVKCNGELVDYDVAINPEGRILLPGLGGLITPADLENVVQLLTEAVEESKKRFKGEEE